MMAGCAEGDGRIARGADAWAKSLAPATTSMASRVAWPTRSSRARRQASSASQKAIRCSRSARMRRRVFRCMPRKINDAYFAGVNTGPATPPADRVFERSERPCFTGSGAAPAGNRPHAKKENPAAWGEAGSVVGTCPSARWGADPRNQPLGCGVTVTDWRLYTADHRQHIDGGGKQTAQEKPRGIARGFRFSGRMGNETRSTH